MEHETWGQEQEPEHEGERYLRLLGLEGLADQPIPGRTERVRDFLDICGKDARPMFIGFASLSPDDPRYEPVLGALRAQVLRFVDTPAES